MAKKIIEGIKHKQKKISEKIKQELEVASERKTMVFSNSEVDTFMEFQKYRDRFKTYEEFFKFQGEVQALAADWNNEGWMKGYYEGKEEVLEWIKENIPLSNKQLKELKRLFHGRQVDELKRDLFPIIKKYLEEENKSIVRKPRLPGRCDYIWNNCPRFKEAFKNGPSELVRYCRRQIKAGNITLK